MNNSIKNSWIAIGRFGKVYGLHGFISIFSYTDPIKKFLSYKKYFINYKEIFQSIIIDAFKHVKNNILIKIKNYESREDSISLSGMDIFIHFTQLERLKYKEYYWFELINIKVFNKQNIFLGTVKKILFTKSNDILIIETTTNLEIFIPYIYEIYILKININQKFIIVDWE